MQQKNMVISIVLLLLSACGGDTTSVPVTSAVNMGHLNDTGVVQWSDGVNHNFTVSQPLFPMQDADFGRDADPLLNSDFDGKAGFSFVKLDALGVPLVKQRRSYAQGRWDCVVDQVTGLTWEVKEKSPGSFRDKRETFSWYNSTGINDGGYSGPNTGWSTEYYVGYINGITLCGYSDWRLPSLLELQSLVDYSVVTFFGVTIDTRYFPNTQDRAGLIPSPYWASSPVAASPQYAWAVGFINGAVTQGAKLNFHFVRLVRGG